MSDFDQQEGNDRKSGKRKGKDQAPQPGKVAGTDNYGQGGTAVNTPVPGKQTGASQLPDGPNGQGQNQNADVGKGNAVDAKADGKGEGKGKDGAAGATGNGTGDKTNADHGDGGSANGPGGKQVAGKGGAPTAKKGADEKKSAAAAKDKGDAGAVAGDKPKAPMFAAKPAQGPQAVDIPNVSGVPNLTLDAPKANKSLSDKWLKETGRSIEQHHQQIQALLTELQGEVQAKQTELLSLQDQQITAVTQDIRGKVENFKSALVVPGRSKVEAAYAGLGKNFDGAEKKALDEIAKHKIAGSAQIATARTTNGQTLEKKFTAAKTTVQQVVTKNIPIAAASIKQFAQGIPGWIVTAKKQATDAAKIVSDKYNPSKGNAANEASAMPSLTEDIYKNFTIKHGTKLGKQYESTLTGYSKDIDKKAEEVVRKALEESKLEFEMALDISGKSSKTNLDAAGTAATTSLTTQETSAKKSVGDAKTNGLKRFETEKKDAVDAADKAGTELSDNATASGTELTDRIKKKAAEDSKSYGAIVVDLQNQLKRGGPHKFEAVQPKVAAAKAQLLKAHTDNTEGLKKLVTEGTTELGVTLTKQQEVYSNAIKDRQEAATKCEAEVIKDIGKGALDMGGALQNLSQGFAETATKETARLDAAIAAFNQNADAATKDFGVKVTQHLEGEKKKLDENLKANLEPAKIATDVDPDAAQEIAAKKKSLGKDASELRNAMDGWGTDENKIYGILRKCSFGEIIYLEGVYNDHYSWRGKKGLPPLRADFDDEMSGNDLKIAMSYLNHDRTTAIKLELADSTGFWNDDEARIEEIMKGASEDEIKFLNTDPGAQKVVKDVKNALGGADLDVVNTLLDTSMEREDRQSKASAVRLFDAMDGWGTNEAKMKEILEGAQTPEERARLRAHFNKYATSKGWDGGDGGAKGEEDDALSRAIKGDTSGGEEALMLTLAKTDRSEEDVKVAKMYEGADGAGTNEEQIFDALDDKDYYEAWKKASPEDKKKLEEARRAKLDAKLDKISGGEEKSIQGLIDGEMAKSNVTYEEFVNGKRADGKALTSQEIALIKCKDPGLNRLEWMVAQRKLQTGQAEPELLLAYACWGVDGTNEEMINKVLGNGGEPKPRAEVNAIRAAFHTRWGVALTDRDELEPINWNFPDPGGVLSDELGGKDWNKTRQLLCGKPETAEQLKYTVKLQAKYATSGFLGGGLMAVGEAIGATEAKSTMEKSEEKFDDFYGKNFAKNPKESLASANGERLQQLADYLSQDIEAYNAALTAIVDAVVTALELIGGVIITVVTAGTASPVLAAIIANLVLSAGTIAFKYAALGDQYGAGDLAADVVKAVGTSAFAGLGEVKALKTLTDNAGKAVTGKLFTALESGVNKGGGRLIGTTIEMGPKGIEKLTGIVAAGTKSVIMNTGQEVYNTLTDEKTYDKKLGEALWGEDSLGMKILKGAPRAFAEGAVTQWINDAAGTSNKDNKGNTTGPKSNALTNAIADMGGATAGFFVYVDNYNDAEQFWMQLLKTNAQKGVGGLMNGYAMHKTRAKKTGRDFINGDATPESLAEMLRYMDAHEVEELAKFVQKYGPDKVAMLPDGFKAKLPKPETKPDPNAPANDNNTTKVDPNHNTASDAVAAPPQAPKKTDGEEQKPAVVAKKTDGTDDEQKPPAAQPVKKPGDQTEDEQKAQTTTKKNDDDKKTVKGTGDDETEAEIAAKKVKSDKETKADETDEQKTKRVEAEAKKKQLADEQKKLATQEDDDRRWSDSDDDLASGTDVKSKRRAKRDQMDDSEEKRKQNIDDWEDEREAVAEGDAKRRAKKEARREEKKKSKAIEKRQGELLDLATQAHAEYAGKIEEAKAVLKQIVGDLGEVQGRAKDPESAANRLKRAEDNFGAKITDVQSAKDNIWDALGTRIVVSGKPEEMAAVMKKITDAVKAGKFEVVKAASNHGDGVESYLSQADLDSINAASGGKADTAGGIKKADADKSAFTSGLIFVKYPDGTRGEIQIIGKATLEVAAIEHIPYDVSLGKPLARGIDEKHAPEMKAITAPVEEAIKQLAKDPQKKAEYDQYLRDLYKHARATELGQESTPPKLPDGIDSALSADGLKQINTQIEALKAKAKAEKAEKEQAAKTKKPGDKDEDDDVARAITIDDKKAKGPKGDDDEDKNATWGDDERQTKKPKPESDDEAKDRRSQAVKPTSKDTDTTHWASPVDRKGVPDTVPLSRQEVRDLVAKQYGHVIGQHAGKAPTEHPEFLDLMSRLKAEPPGSLGKTPEGKAKAKAYLDEWIAISHKLEKQSGHSEKDLRFLYNDIEQHDFPKWYETVKHLPKEQQAKIGHMWREELKIYVRDMMGDSNSKEVLYLRDLAMSGDRRGPRFEDLYDKQLKANKGDPDKAYDGIIGTTMTSNKDVNKGITGSEKGSTQKKGDGDDEAAKLAALKAKTKDEDEAVDKDDPKKTTKKPNDKDDDKDEADLSARKITTDGDDKKVSNVKKPTNEKEETDAKKIASSTDKLEKELTELNGKSIAKKMTPPPPGKPVIEQGSGDALIGLAIDAIPPTASADAALKQFQEKGIPRWASLTENERKHETAFAETIEKNMGKLVDDFFKASVKVAKGDDGKAHDTETYQFEVDGAKKLYAAYGSKPTMTDSEMNVRATANHALHPAAVALARLAFLKRLDQMAAMSPDDPLRNVFVTNGGCASGKGSLFGVAEGQLGKQAKFGAVWDAAGEGDAQENMWILQAAKARGIKVTYGFVENDPMANYKGVLERALSTGRIVDPITYARSYVRGQENMKAFLNSPEYQEMLKSGEVQTFGVNAIERRKNPDDPNAGLLGNKGKIGADHIPDAPDEVAVTEAAIKDFKEWLARKKKDDPNFKYEMWLEGGGTNALKFKPVTDDKPSAEGEGKVKTATGDEGKDEDSRVIAGVKEMPPDDKGLDVNGKPKTKTQTTSLDGQSFENDLTKMSPEARHLIRQMDERGWVRVDSISQKDLVEISKWYGKEIGVVQSAYGKLRIILGQERGVLKSQIAPGETFVVHTHPVMSTEKGHFAKDIENAGKNVEAVIDWSGQVTYFSKAGLKNPVRPDGTVESLHGYEAAFIGADGRIVGYARVDIIDGPEGARIKVTE